MLQQIGKRYRPGRAARSHAHLRGPVRSVQREYRAGELCAARAKLGEGQVDAAANTLLRMKGKMVADGAQPPVCLAVITGGGIARIREDGVYVLPITAIRH